MRDRLMTRCDGAFAGYGLASHKGYSTKAHQAALAELGPCRLHRRSFWRVAACFDAD
jgi:ribonuclease HII